MNPVVGITQLNNLNDWVSEEIDNGIDVNYEQCLSDCRDEVISEGKLTEEYDIEEEVERRMEYYDRSDGTILLGDWELVDGKYQPCLNGPNGFAATYSNFCGGTISVEWSKFTTNCAQTSPCFMMTNGQGTCGDLDTKGNAKIAYTLPKEWFREY